MNMILFLSYLLILFVYNLFPTRINILNNSFNELVIRIFGAFFCGAGLFLQRKDDLFFIEEKSVVIFYVVIILSMTFILLVAFVGNKVDLSKVLNINRYDIITCILSLFIMIYCFLYYGDLNIYPFSSNFLFLINILFFLWIIALWKSRKK